MEVVLTKEAQELSAQECSENWPSEQTTGLSHSVQLTLRKGGRRCQSDQLYGSYLPQNLVFYLPDNLSLILLKLLTNLKSLKSFKMSKIISSNSIYTLHTAQLSPSIYFQLPHAKHALQPLGHLSNPTQVSTSISPFQSIIQEDHLPFTFIQSTSMKMPLSVNFNVILF